ncbi:hypothetical protein [Streptomyces sp. NRRL F-5527]|uniref:hypothetical protein n=1 Tax=Streptomyces sp. NRRL F-5527 TaxID=1463862 RepID=UPI00131B973A|nr:hypothetical protein [Streptomyces sp. NRRL F-5527]
MTTTKQVHLLCGGPGCGEPWTYHRPKGRRGPNPKTNPDHERCNVKRQNRKRYLSRERQRTGEVTFYWNIRKVSDVPFESMTEEEQLLYVDSINRPWWPIGTVQDLPEEGWEVREIVPEAAQPAWECSTNDDVEKVRLWMHESDAKVATGCEVGRTAERDHAVIGSAAPWWFVDIPHPGSNRPLSSMDSFVMVL